MGVVLGCGRVRVLRGGGVGRIGSTYVFFLFVCKERLMCAMCYFFFLFLLNSFIL